MKKMKKIISMLLCLVVCFCLMNVDAGAAGPRDGEVVDGTLLMSDISSIGSASPELRGTYLASGFSGITRDGSVVIISGETLCHRVSDAVTVDLYLEKLVGDIWMPVTQKSHTAYNTGMASYTTSVLVSRGYYYRVRGGHTAKKGSVSETNYSQTKAIYVG